MLDTAKFALGGNAARSAVAEWAVRELKDVHAGKANLHVHEALDALLAALAAPSA